MAKSTVSYCWNGRQLSLNDVSNLSSELPEERAIAIAILEWNKNQNFRFNTSGSTGPPKQITFTKQQVARSIELTKNTFNLSSKDKAFLALPMKYVAGKIMLYRALHLGMNLVSVDPKIDLSTMYGTNVSFAAFIPLQIEKMILSEEGRKWLNNIRVVLVGGGPISLDMEKELAKYENKICHTYGMTETLTHVAIRQLSKGGESSYSALPGIHLSIGASSNLVIQAEHLDVTIETNDVVDMKENGVFEILGRLDNVINSGGLKIYPEHVESRLRPILKREIAVIGVPDPSLGTKLVLVIESNQTIDPEWLQAAYLELPKNERPKEVRYTAEFPRTNSRKIQRDRLTEILLIPTAKSLSTSQKPKPGQDALRNH